MIEPESNHRQNFEVNLPEPNKFSGLAYRNIATCSPSQYVFDDLCDDPDELEILSNLESISANVDRTKPSVFRAFQYGNIDNSLACFEKDLWSVGRFGAAEFGVWYGAFEDTTSIAETLFHRPEIDQNDLNNALSPIIQDRRMFEAKIKDHRSIDLRNEVKRYPGILNSTDYRFCQQLGEWARLSSIQSFLTPSLRDPGGTCIPIFEPEIISDRYLYDYHAVFPLQGQNPYWTKKMDIVA